MKNLLLIFLLAPLLSVAQVPPKPNTNVVAQVVTLVGTNIMPTAVRPIVEGWFVAGNVTTQSVEDAISRRGYTTTNDVLALIPSGSITTQDVENVITSKGYITTNDVLNLLPSTAGLVSETNSVYLNLLAISAMSLRVYETNGVWKTLLPGETLP